MFLSLAGSGFYIWYQEGPGKERAIAAHMKQEAARSIPVVEEQALPPWEEPQVVARVPAYRVAPDLSNVANPEALGFLTTDERERLVAQGFFVRPSAAPDPVSLYRDNAARGIPSLITADTLCYLYRAIQAHAVAQAEQRLYPLLQSLTTRMLEGSRSIYRQVENPRVKEAARRNMAYFAVAARLLDERAEVPAEVQDMVSRELDLIYAAAGPATGAVFPYEVDYEVFVPHGHYTWTPELERYYRAVTWYGSVPLYPTRGKAGEVGAEPSDQVIQAILFTEALFRWSLGRIGPIEKWDRLYTSMSFLYGQDDALHPRDALRLIEEIFGRRPNLDELADPAKLRTFVLKARELAAVKGVPPVFKFVGPFVSVDRAILDRLAGDGVSGVRAQDLLALLGSETARAGDAHTPDRAARLEQMRKELATIPLERWHTSAAGGFLWALQPLLAPKGTGFPLFMEGPAWEGRNLLTGLSALALLHLEDWKAAAPQQEGATWRGSSPAVPVYVEPELAFYARLAWLARYTRDFLDGRDLLTGSAAERLRHFEQLATLLKKAAAQELAGAPLNGDQKQRLGAWGETMAGVLADLGIAGREGLPGHPGAVVTLYRAGERVFQAALGPPLEIVAVVPVEGRLYLARGAVLGCREVTRSADAPLTDRQWLETLAEGAPPFPAWTGNFLLPPPPAD